METSHMLRTLITDPQQYYSASLHCYEAAGKHVAHLPLTGDVTGKIFKARASHNIFIRILQALLQNRHNLWTQVLI
jgi:hypothetical protein